MKLMNLMMKSQKGSQEQKKQMKRISQRKVIAIQNHKNKTLR
jgi:hypothetical protein